MALSIQDLKNMASTVVETTDGPTHVGTGQQITTTDDAPKSTNTTVVDGDNRGGIRQTFTR
ncbi:hypothetical protein ACFVYG_36680 [Streptomyces sp. NPDC058256]|uniref:hypothetical protein n=1 Tax=Streptomyces sp. NPDC058256 TaxID=3346408 RepID=UPI0036F17E0B